MGVWISIMKVTWRTFPKLFIVLPVLHYALSVYTNAESEEHKRKKELEQTKEVHLIEQSGQKQK
ncbi:uncharacterized protein LOC117790655 [Drosophila innubila]|uniref:uncharacterized protein LOC117790655 n=1 Tax=Drosophila innubila TaxID=198719 RepID=UPI00148C9229|nr:uncharacterized protein LOC117790655 [Drosophila innubila]